MAEPPRLPETPFSPGINVTQVPVPAFSNTLPPMEWAESSFDPDTPAEATRSLKRTRTTDVTYSGKSLAELAHNELIQIISSLQQQNATLTNLLAQAMNASYLVSAGTTVITDPSHPSFKATGSAASRWASKPATVTQPKKDTPTSAASNGTREKDDEQFPKLASSSKKDKTKKSAPKSATSGNTTNNKANNSATGKKTQPKKFQEATPKAKEWAMRLFTTPKDQDLTTAAPPTGFTFLYLPSNKRSKYSELRDRLRLLGVKLNRVYSIQRPAKKVIALLVHQGYAEELSAIFATAGIELVQDFNPIDPKNIGDPKLLESLQNDVQRAAKAQAIYFNHMLEAVCSLKDAQLGLSILRHFSDPKDTHFIPPQLIQQYLTLRPNALKIRKTAAPTVLQGFDAASLFTVLTPPSASGTTSGNSQESSPGVTTTLQNEENARSMHVDQ